MASETYDSYVCLYSYDRKKELKTGDTFKENEDILVYCQDSEGRKSIGGDYWVKDMIDFKSKKIINCPFKMPKFTNKR